jgi:hypothetical protein
MKRTVLAGLLGGLTAFVWSAISHTVLPLGTMGIGTLPNEERTIAALRDTLPASGLYLFPAPDLSESAPADAQERWMERYRTGPTGFLVYRPVGGEFSYPLHLAIELLTTVLAALVAATLLTRTPITVAQGALCGAGLGVFTWLSITMSYTNWYDFPTAFSMAEGIDQLVSWGLAGAVIAKVGGARTP